MMKNNKLYSLFSRLHKLCNAIMIRQFFFSKTRILQCLDKVSGIYGAL